MSSILELIYGSEVRHFDAGQVVIDQGKKTDLLFFLVEGPVEVPAGTLCRLTLE